MSQRTMFRARWMRGVLAALIVVMVLPSAEVVAEADRFPCATDEQRTRDQQQPAQEDLGTEIGQVAPDFRLPDMDGNEVSLTGVRGCVAIIEFWASWCPPCWQSAVHLGELSQRYEDRGLVVLGVSLDQSRDAIENFLKATGEPDITVLWGSFGAAREVAQKYGVQGIPQALVVDRDGVIRYMGHPALIDADTLAPLW